MQPWEKIEYRLKEIESKINQIRNDLKEIKPKIWESGEDKFDERIYNLREQRYYDLRAQLDADYKNMTQNNEKLP